jgi:hypothetical protein
MDGANAAHGLIRQPKTQGIDTVRCGDGCAPYDMVMHVQNVPQ